MDKLIVAIDGPGGSGKSTVSRETGRRLRLPHLDTGAFYRAATVVTLERGIDPGDGPGIAAALASVDIRFDDGRTMLDGEDVSERIRSEWVTAAVSRLSANPEVRRLMVDRQRSWVACHGGSAVVEGRDIGTVVFPDAPVKVFLTARPQVRARRRSAEGSVAAEESLVAAELARRDRFDSTREVSPLRPAAGAVEIDTSDMDVAEVVERIVELVRVSASRPTT
jgi:cytidylate kinase